MRGPEVSRRDRQRLINSSFQIFSHFSDSSNTVTGSTIVYLKVLVLPFTLRLAGERPRDWNSSCPSGDIRKSANNSAACGCGAFFATATPCGRATTGSTGAQSIGPPLRLSDSALAWYVVKPTGISPAA